MAGPLLKPYRRGFFVPRDVCLPGRSDAGQPARGGPPGPGGAQARVQRRRRTDGDAAGLRPRTGEWEAPCDSRLSSRRIAIMSFAKNLRCRECGRVYPLDPMHVCEFCFGPLEVFYDYEALRHTLTRERIERGPLSMWRYADLLPA